MAYQEVCQLMMEQEIEEGLQEGKTPYSIGKEVAALMQRIFDVKIPPNTIEQRAGRIKNRLLTNVSSDASTCSDDKEEPEINVSVVLGPPKFIVKKDNSQFRTSGTSENEWYTPIQYIEAARTVMGTIDLDPATSEFGQSRIRATRYFTDDTNGLIQHWNGRVWLNPPYSQPLIMKFSDKIVDEYKSRNVKEAIVLTHNYTDTLWFHRLESVSEYLCFTRGRIRFESEDGRLACPTQGSVFFYLGENSNVFKKVYREFGFVR